MKKLRHLFGRLLCFLPLGRGHDLIPTGRHGHILVEFVCKRCGRLMIGNTDCPGAYFPSDIISDDIMEDQRTLDVLKGRKPWMN